MTSKFDQRVKELRAQGVRPQQANETALREERARNEQIADRTYRKAEK